MVVINGGLSVESFTIEIESLVKSHKMDYIDAVVFFCEKNNIEVETAALIVKKNLNMISKLQFEAENLNILEKTSRLPF